MPLYIRLPPSDDPVIDLWGEAEAVELRAHASEVVYSDAAYLKAIAAEKWPEFSWRRAVPNSAIRRESLCWLREASLIPKR